MSPKKESRRSSPRKSAEDPSQSNLNNNQEKKGIKLRLKVKSNEVVSDNVTVNNNANFNDSANTIDSSVKASNVVNPVKIIKLNFSRSNESVTVPSPLPTGKGKGKRGRPKKDKSAVIAAALAASQPNEAESEERRSRRRAAEEKIKKSISMDSVKNNVVIEEEQNNKRKANDNVDVTDTSNGANRKRRRRRKSNEDENVELESDNRIVRRSKSNDYVDITDNHDHSQIHNQRNRNNSITSNFVPFSTTFNPHETEFIQRSKTFLNISYQHDAFMYTSMLANPLDMEPFKTTEEMVEKLAAFHVGIGAGQYIPEELFDKELSVFDDDSKHLDTLDSLQQRYRQIIHSQSSKKVPTELLLLEQRLCLEEEKFLLVKLKNEYAARFLKPSSSVGSSANSSSIGSSRSSTPSV